MRFRGRHGSTESFRNAVDACWTPHSPRKSFSSFPQPVSRKNDSRHAKSEVIINKNQDQENLKKDWPRDQNGSILLTLSNFDNSKTKLVFSSKNQNIGTINFRNNKGSGGTRHSGRSRVRKVTSKLVNRSSMGTDMAQSTCLHVGIEAPTAILLQRQALLVQTENTPIGDTPARYIGEYSLSIGLIGTETQKISAVGLARKQLRSSITSHAPFPRWMRP